MSLEQFLNKIKAQAETITFAETIEVIEENYDFTPTRFTNGETVNETNQNNGSCKIFSFAKLHDLSKEETLQLFGDYYRKEVLENPTGTDHANIRNFMQQGWDGVQFEGNALIKK